MLLRFYFFLLLSSFSTLYFSFFLTINCTMFFNFLYIVTKKFSPIIVIPNDDNLKITLIFHRSTIPSRKITLSTLTVAIYLHGGLIPNKEGKVDVNIVDETIESRSHNSITKNNLISKQCRFPPAGGKMAGVQRAAPVTS